MKILASVTKNSHQDHEPLIIFTKHSILDVGKVLNMPLVYLSCFSKVLRGIHRKVDIYQTDFSIHSKLRIFPYSEVKHENTTFKLTKGL